MKCLNIGCGHKELKLYRPDGTENPFYQWGFCDSDCYTGYQRGRAMTSWLIFLKNVTKFMEG